MSFYSFLHEFEDEALEIRVLLLICPFFLGSVSFADPVRRKPEVLWPWSFLAELTRIFVPRLSWLFMTSVSSTAMVLRLVLGWANLESLSETLGLLVLDDRDVDELFSERFF